MVSITGEVISEVANSFCKNQTMLLQQLNVKSIRKRMKKNVFILDPVREGATNILT